MAESIKKPLARVEPDRPISSIETMEDVVRDSVRPRPFPMILLSRFRCWLTLAAVGILGVVSYSDAAHPRDRDSDRVGGS